MTKFIEQQDIPFFLPTYNADFDHILGSETIPSKVLSNLSLDLKETLT